LAVPGYEAGELLLRHRVGVRQARGRAAAPGPEDRVVAADRVVERAATGELAADRRERRAAPAGAGVRWAAQRLVGRAAAVLGLPGRLRATAPPGVAAVVLAVDTRRAAGHPGRTAAATEGGRAAVRPTRAAVPAELVVR